jgi:type I restriction enzyme, S subunit
MIDWQSTTWGNVCELRYGKGLRGYKDVKGTVPVYGTNGPVGWCDEPLSNIPSVIIGRKGAYRGVHYSNQPFFVIDTAFFLVPSDQLDTKWAYYNLLTVDINGMDSGSAIPSTSRDDFYRLPLNLPPLTQQKTISSILGAIDDKIQNNHQINETLEDKAHAIFKSWFIDFDPVHAKVGDKLPTYIDAETASLFPNTLGDDGLPVGWCVSKIEDIVDRQKAGKLFSKKTVHEIGNIPVLDQSATDIIGFHNEEPSVLASPLERVITFANHTCVLRLIDFNFSAIQNVIPFKGKRYPTEWVFFACSNKQKFEEYKGHWPTFLVQPVIIPNDKTTFAFAKIVEPIISKISANFLQNQTLAELRNTLLSKLISGEIRVKDAEREVEAAI